eukprot:6470349-Amphidinium_carterae.1
MVTPSAFVPDSEDQRVTEGVVCHAARMIPYLVQVWSAFVCTMQTLQNTYAVANNAGHMWSSGTGAWWSAIVLPS